MYAEFDHYNHRRLWDWLSEHPDKNKIDWPEWKQNGGDVDFVYRGCFACEYAIRVMPHTGDPKDAFTSKKCKHCPFGDFSIHNSDVMDLAEALKNVLYPDAKCLGGLYEHYSQCQFLFEKSRLARQIRDLPLREDYKVHTVVHEHIKYRTMSVYEYYQAKWIKKHDIRIGDKVKLRYQTVPDHLKSEYLCALTKEQFSVLCGGNYVIKRIMTTHIEVCNLEGSIRFDVNYFNIIKLKY